MRINCSKTESQMNCDECAIENSPLVIFESFAFMICKKCLFNAWLMIEDSEAGVFEPTICLHCNEVSNKVDSPAGCNACGNEWL